MSKVSRFGACTSKYSYWQDMDGVFNVFAGSSYHQVRATCMTQCHIAQSVIRF